MKGQRLSSVQHGWEKFKQVCPLNVDANVALWQSNYLWMIPFALSISIAWTISTKLENHAMVWTLEDIVQVWRIAVGRRSHKVPELSLISPEK